MFLLDNVILHFEANKYSDASNLTKNDTKTRTVYVNKEGFENSFSWETGEAMHKICSHCGKKKCSCGGCPNTNFYELMRKFNQVPACQRCICNQVESDLVNNTLNNTGKSLDELINERRRKGKRLQPLKKITAEDYEKGDVIKQGNDFRNIKGSKSW